VAIRRAGCSVGRIRRVRSRRSRGIVLAQRPRPGALLPRGGRVHLAVSRGRR
jgi:beta-lactam-binding protein with PASTA domain